MIIEAGKHKLTKGKIPSEVFLLEETFGIEFKDPPVKRGLTLLSSYRIVANAIDKYKLTGTSKHLINMVLPFAAPFAFLYMDGAYIGDENTFYQRRIRSKSKNLFGEKIITSADYQRFVAVHELTHGYLKEQGQDKGRHLMDLINALINGSVPANFETVVTEGVWNEGICTFAAVCIEERFIRCGKLKQRGSYGLKFKHFALTGRGRVPREEADNIDMFTIQPDDEWIQRCNNWLQHDFARIQELNITRTLSSDPNRLFKELNPPSMPIGMQYAAGYNAAMGAFRCLQSLGFSTNEAFQHISTNTPKTVYELMHPGTYINFTLQ